MRARLPAGLRPRGEVRVPGDKSVAHRALMIAALADGDSRIGNLPDGADVRSTADCLGQLGIDVAWAGDTAVIRGNGLRGLTPPSGPLDCGNSGTTMRLLAGVLAAEPFDSVLDGDASLRSRPMERIAEPLRQMGAAVETADGAAPVVITGTRQLRGIEYHTPVASAQIKSAVLLAGLRAEGATTVKEDAPSRDHTERLLGSLGANVTGTAHEGGVTIEPASALRPMEGAVPGDISSAAYWLAATAVAADGEVTLAHVGLNPTRTAIVRVLREWGAAIEVEENGHWNGEPVGTLRVAAAGQRLRGGSIDGEDVVGLIDEIPLLALLATVSEAGLALRDAGELRHKESDRIATTAAAIRALGGKVVERPDGLEIPGRQELCSGTVDARGDHRIALAAAAVAPAVAGEVNIDGAEAAAVSYPQFLRDLQSVGSP